MRDALCDGRMRCAMVGCDARCFVRSMVGCDARGNFHRASHPTIAPRIARCAARGKNIAPRIARCAARGKTSRLASRDALREGKTSRLASRDARREGKTSRLASREAIVCAFRRKGPWESDIYDQSFCVLTSAVAVAFPKPTKVPYRTKVK